MTQEELIKHVYGSNVVHELATKLYKDPIAAFREGVSNALDAMINYPEDPMVKIYTNVRPDGDIIFEDWGTGVEDFDVFITISSGKKVVGEEVSSYENINEKIIGQKGMGKLSFLNLSSTPAVEFYSHSKDVGMHVVMTMEGFKVKHMNNSIALPHHGLKVVIKQAKKPVVQDSRLREYLSRTFAIKIARGAKIFVNDIQVNKPEGFDTRQFEYFTLTNGTKVVGNLNAVEKPRPNNIGVYVKQVYVDSKPFEYKVEGWLNCDSLVLDTSRDGIYEDEVYADFMQRLSQHLELHYDKKTDSKPKDLKSEKHIAKMFVNVVKSINDLFPEMNKPYMAGNLSDQRGIGTVSKLKGNVESRCIEQEGSLDMTKTVSPSISKPIGNGKSHKRGDGESKSRIREGNDRLLAPPAVLLSGNGIMPEPKVVVIDADERPVVFFAPPDRLVINQGRPASRILIDANPKDPYLKSRILPLLVRAGIAYFFSRNSDMSTEEGFKMYDAVLDSAYSR